MPIHLIANVIYHKNKFVIGSKNELIVKLSKDLKFFKEVTSKNDNNLVFSKNIVVMGSNTWYSIDSFYRPLKDRINIVITNDKELGKLNPDFSYELIKKEVERNESNQIYFVNLQQFKKFYKNYNPTVFLIGGGRLYNTFLNDRHLKPEKLYITHVSNYRFPKNNNDFIYLNGIDNQYKLLSFSEKYYDIKNNVYYRFLMYRHNNQPNQLGANEIYTDLCKNILENGTERSDRTDIGTISIFGAQVVYDMSFSIPLLTTKNVPWKHVIEELLWFMRGDTDAKILQREGVKIWNGNTSRAFLDSRGLFTYPEGTLGAGYGWQWRFFGANYDPKYSDTSDFDTYTIGGFDQLRYIENQLKTNPYSRRILMCYWNPPDFKKTALLPCHFSCQFYVEDEDKNIDSKKILHCLFNMRSNDIFLGHPFNIASYAILTAILAMRCDMRPGKLIYTGGDVHIYKNHISQVLEQMNRTSLPLPVLTINPDVKYKNYEDIIVSDFDLVGYFPHPSIKAPMAV